MAQASEKKAATIEAKKCVTHEFRVSFPAIAEPKSFEDQPAKYGLTMMFPKAVNLAKPANPKTQSMKHAAFAAAEEKWGPKEKWPKNLRMPFRDGNDKEDLEGYADHIFVSATSKTQPGLVDQSLKPMLNPAKDFYAGCYARAELIAFAYDKAGNKGVSFSLQNLQKLREGEPFSGRRNAADVFDSVEDASESESEDEDDGLGF